MDIHAFNQQHYEGLMKINQTQAVFTFIGILDRLQKSGINVLSILTLQEP